MPLRDKEKYKEYQKQYRAKNKKKASDSIKEWKKNNFTKHKDLVYMNLYGITHGEYLKMLFIQNEVCRICKEECPSGRNLAVDHDHKTGEIRGLLCGRCNRGLGYFKDDPLLLREAAWYLFKLEEV